VSVERRARVERSIYSRACFTPAAARDEGTDWVATLGIKGKGLTPGERETCCQRVRPSVESLSVFGTVPDMVFFVIELRSQAVHIAGVRRVAFLDDRLHQSIIEDCASFQNRASRFSLPVSGCLGPRLRSPGQRAFC
jgi:hypothetical protein